MSRKSAFRPRSVELEITAIGARGDGLAKYDGEPVFVPLTVPGDHITARLDGRRGDGLTASLLSIGRPGPDRQAAPCPLFGRCGGCSLQQLTPPALAEWKRGRLVTALGRIGIDPTLIAPLIAIPPGTRRRAAFAFARQKQGILLGFNERASHRLIDVETCLILSPSLLALLPSLRTLLLESCAPGSSGDVLLTLTDSGIDMLIQSEQKLDLFARERLAYYADENDLARLSWQSHGLTEPVAHRRTVQVTMGGVAVGLPPGGFLQPSREGEAALVALVLAALPERGIILDLYAGSGAFTFPTARAGHAVHAVEGEESAIASLAAAAKQSGLPITSERRDLAHRPLLAHEMKNTAAAIFDPPRAGAAAQAEQLAKSGPPILIAVSCNPATLARDAEMLLAAGYRLIQATPVDQFPYSSHLEAVALFHRP